jgi:hypothetical protein
VVFPPPHRDPSTSGPDYDPHEPRDADFPRAWIEFTDPADADQRIRADLTWLTSRYHCIFGQGCPGIDASVGHAGCCVHGAHFADADDEDRVTAWVQELTDDEWEQHPGGQKIRKRDWIEKDDDGERKTRVRNNACIFLNSPDFDDGPGCALHLLALRRGQSHVATKPDVCWQLPLRRDYDWREEADGNSTLIISVSEYTRGKWGPGGHEFDWYCTDNPMAHTANEPLYITSRDELVQMLGAAAYAELCRHCEAFEAVTAAVAPAPGAMILPIHPATSGDCEPDTTHPHPA